MRINEIAAVRVRYGYTSVFTCCCVARAGWSTTSGCIGFTVRKG
jgi:hypothetical protein